MGSPTGREGSVGRPSGISLFTGAVTLLVAGVVVVGLFVAGSPGKERDRRFDEQRVNELQQIANAVDASYDRTRRLPATLAELQTPGKNEYYVPSLLDPKTGVPYEYRVAGDTGYELCATFDQPTQETNQTTAAVPPRPVAYPASEWPYGRDWTHPAGRHCYSLDAEAGRLVQEACSLTNPCQAGQNCVTLPDRKGSYCVPAGKECLAAGCAPDACTIAESYPAQVRCAGQ